MRIYTLSVSDNLTLHTSVENRDHELRAFVDQFWDEAVQRGADPNTSAEKRVEAYFEAMSLDESYWTATYDVELGDPEAMKAALSACAKAADGDSNDAEIAALNDALDTALQRWPEIDRQAISDAYWDVDKGID